ncbi:MAG: protein translocase subunit SecD [Spirochaetaceae bacterium]|jgi:preprotein translocase subunit SecD|nr:protein translocase subunit SecD [Spirochaetaceae bacterium]
MKKRYRFFILLITVGLCSVFLYPTARWYFFVPKDEQNLALGSREQIRDYARRTAGQDIEKLVAAARAGEGLPEGMEFLLEGAKKEYKLAGRELPKTWDAVTVLQVFTRSGIQDFIESYYRDKIFKLKNLQQNAVQLGLDLSGGLSIVLQGDMEALNERFRAQYGQNITAEAQQEVFDQALEVLNGRIDRFGLTEPVIRKQGTDQIYVEIPGNADPERIRNIIMGKGGLAFHIVDEEASNAFYRYMQEHPGMVPNEDGTLPVEVEGVPQDDVLILGIYQRDQYGLDEWTGYAAVKKQVGLDGNHIRDARAERSGQLSQPVATFLLDSEGGDIFYEFTSANVGKPLAIVLDNRIRSIAVINEGIHEAVQLKGLDMGEANNIAVILRTAALPVELEVVNQQSIGPSLGADTITRGLYALLGGLAVVMAFMLLYYRTAGINAVIAQILNIYLMFSILSVLNFTLTLPSIAGFILTIGMAVDANVIIFERMKEELRLGKGRRAAVNAGFEKAFWAIMDSNITTFIAALFLSQLGTGPIKGFAVSLAIGVFSSVFTALFVSRLIFDFSTDVMGSKRLLVSWFIKPAAAARSGGGSQ